MAGGGIISFNRCLEEMKISRRFVCLAVLVLVVAFSLGEARKKSVKSGKGNGRGEYVGGGNGISGLLQENPHRGLVWLDQGPDLQDPVQLDY